MSGRSIWIHVGRDVCSLVGGQIHATDWIDTVAKKGKCSRKTHPTRCGRQRARLIGVGTVNERGESTGSMTVPWPPYVEEIREDGLERCRECFALKPGKPNRLVSNPYKASRRGRVAS